MVIALKNRSSWATNHNTHYCTHGLNTKPTKIKVSIDGYGPEKQRCITQLARLLPAWKLSTSQLTIVLEHFFKIDIGEATTI